MEALKQAVARLEENFSKCVGRDECNKIHTRIWDAVNELDARVRIIAEQAAETKVYLKQIKDVVDQLRASQLTREDIVKILTSQAEQREATAKQAETQNKTWLEGLKIGSETIGTIVKLTIGALIYYLVTKGGTH